MISIVVSTLIEYKVLKKFVYHKYTIHYSGIVLLYLMNLYVC